jgi:hypothetical protein
LSFCLTGYPPGTAVRLVLQGPGGAIYGAEGSDEGVGIDVTTSMPVGRWSAQVTAPGLPDATATVEVSMATEPTVLQVRYSGQAGQAGLAVELGGFAPNSTVNVFLYGPPPEEALKLIRSLPAVMVDGEGEATYAVGVDPADPPGLYGIWLNPGPYCTERNVPCASYRK